MFSPSMAASRDTSNVSLGELGVGGSYLPEMGQWIKFDAARTVAADVSNVSIIPISTYPAHATFSLIPNSSVRFVCKIDPNIIIKKANGEIVEHGDLSYTHVVSDANNNITFIPFSQSEIAKGRARTENPSSAASVDEASENSPIDLRPLPHLSHTLLPHEVNANMPNTTPPPVLIESSANAASASSPYSSSYFQQVWNNAQPQILDGSVDFSNPSPNSEQLSQTNEVLQQAWDSIENARENVSDFPDIDKMSPTEIFQAFYDSPDQEQASAAAASPSNPSMMDLLIGEDPATIEESGESEFLFRAIHLPASFTGESSTIHAFEQTHNCGTANPVISLFSHL